MCFRPQFEELICIEEIKPQITLLLDTPVGVKIDGRTGILCATFGCDEDHTIGSPRSIDRYGRGIFKNRDRLDVMTADIIDVGRNIAIYNKNRRVASADRLVSEIGRASCRESV